MIKILVLTDGFEKTRRFFHQAILINAKTNDEIMRPALGPLSINNGCGRQIADL